MNHLVVTGGSGQTTDQSTRLNPNLLHIRANPCARRPPDRRTRECASRYHRVTAGEKERAEPSPETLLEEIARFAELEGERYFRALDACPCCLSKSIERRYFHKFGFPHSLCRACEFIFLDPSPSDEALGLLYNSSFYAGTRKHIEASQAERGADYASTSLERSEAEKVIQRTLRCLTKKDSPRWLDLGGGIGYFLNLVRQLAPGVACSLLETNEFSVECARRQFGLDIVASLPSESEDSVRYDVVSLIAVLEHVPQPRELLSLVRDNLASDGLLTLTIPQAPGLVRRRSREEYAYFLPPYHASMFHRDNLVDLCLGLGFETLDVWEGGGPAFACEHFFRFHSKLDTRIPQRDQEVLETVVHPPFATAEWIARNCCRVANRLTRPIRKRLGRELLHLVARRR